MPHGRHLTPLGKQLRSVLANLSIAAPWSHPPSHHPSSSHVFGPGNAIRTLHNGPPRQASTGNATTTENPEEEASTTYQPTLPNSHFTRRSARAVRKGARIDHLSDALKTTGDPAVLPYQPLGKQDLSHFNIKSSTGFHEFRERRARHRTPPPNTSVSLQHIVAAYISRPNLNHPLDAEWQPVESEYIPSPLDTDFLRAKGYDLADVVAWAEIAITSSVFVAAEKLLHRIRICGALSTPLFIYLNLLRRSYVSARALHLLILCGHELFQQRAKALPDPGIDNEPRLLVAIRLIRHAREVWPDAFVSVMELVLGHLQTGKLTEENTPRVTYQLNLLIKLVSLSTAERPFKDNHYQECAIIPVLRYMAETNPPLLINRAGYRAVIRLQLAQRKTDHEQQWAELKSLSWPPWKVDRTAMDASINVEDHGTSRAAQTLQAMREAGYSPRQWERTAQVFSGWDIDGTPTIQTRVRLDVLSERHRQTHTDVWAARITTTRTIQEAWACYLAWEDCKSCHNYQVYLAIATKLSEEQRRSRIESRQVSQPWGRKGMWPLLHGDSREIAPLPPSTHLYTYTRTLPPTLERFYTDIRTKGAVLSADCLAYFVEHAPNLEFALACLRDHVTSWPAIQGILSLGASHDLSKLPLVIYTAVLNLFGRFAYVSSAKTSHVQLTTESREPRLHGFTLDTQIGIVRAIELLRRRPDPYPPLWHAVFAGLVRETSLNRFATLFITRPVDEDDTLPACELSEELERCEGAFNAYRLVRSLRTIQRENHLDSDLECFHNFCIATENLALASWVILQESETRTRSQEVDPRRRHAFDRLNRNVKGLFSSAPKHLPNDLLSQEFLGLMSPTEVVSSEVSEKLTSLPRLLAIPSPAVLHAYIRALGWLADYDGLLELVRWMCEYRVELAERRSRDRRGEDMMRKAIIALRTFLERSFLTTNGGDETAIPFKPFNDEEKSKKAEIKGMGGWKEKLTARYREARIQRLLAQFRVPATDELIVAVRDVVESVEEWDGWPGDWEVERYIADKRFERVK